MRLCSTTRGLTWWLRAGWKREQRAVPGRSGAGPHLAIGEAPGHTGAGPRDQSVERAERLDRVPHRAGAGLRLDAAGPSRRAGLAAAYRRRLHPGHLDRQPGRLPGPSAQPGDEVRQAGRPDRRQGPHRDGLDLPVGHRRTLVVGHRGDPGAGVGHHRPALRDAALRGDGRRPGRQDQDVRAGDCDHPVPAAARRLGGVVAGPRRGGNLGRGGRDACRRAAHRGHRAGLSARGVPAPPPEPVGPVNLSPAARVLAELQRRGEGVAPAESLTGGLLGGLLTAVPGASAAYVGGVISYATRLKETLVGVDLRLLDTLGPVAGPTAAAMAAGVARRCEADWGVATTGVAGPDPQDGHPVGEVYVAVARPARDRVEVRALRLTGDRPAIREAAADQALDLLSSCLGLENPEPGVRVGEQT